MMNDAEVEDHNEAFLTDDQQTQSGFGFGVKTNSWSKLLYGIIVGCFVVIIGLLFVNLWQAGYLDSSANSGGGGKEDGGDDIIAMEDVCSGNGNRYTDVNVCECYQCYDGSECEREVDDCRIGAGSGQPFLFLEHWFAKAKSHELPALELPIDYRVPYQSSVMGPFSETANSTFSQKLSQVIRKVHRKYHNVNITDSYLVYGVGASQLQTAAYVAYSKLKGKPIIAFNAVPYYFSYPSRCTGASPAYCSEFSTATNLSSDDVVEYVIIPDNPRGYAGERVYTDPNTSWALDLVYYWPHFYDSSDDLEEQDAPISFFSFTKLTGHAGTRFGWAFVKDYELASAMRSYISSSVLAISIESMARAFQIHTYLLNDGDAYFDFVRARMHDRWELFGDVLEGQQNYIIRSRPYTQYGWLECVNKTEDELQTLFWSYNLNPYWGSRFGAPGYVRFNLAEHEGTWIRIMKSFKELVDAER